GHRAQPAEAAPEREARDPGVADGAGGHGEAVLLAGGVEVGEGGPAAAPRPPRDRVDDDRVHRAEVDREPSVGHGCATDVVPTAPDGDLEAVLLPPQQRRGDVVGRFAAGDDRGRAVDGAVPDEAGRVVVARQQHLSVHRLPQGVDPAAHRVRHPLPLLVVPQGGADAAVPDTGRCQAGSMFALRWKTLPGSYRPLIRASRSYFSSPYAARMRWSSYSAIAVT